MCVVLKFGSSVLSSPTEIPVVVETIRRTHHDGTGVIAVVSAFAGETDRLTALGRSFGTDSAALAALLSTGELQSAALLTLALQAAGLRATVCDAARIALRTAGPIDDAVPLDLSHETIRALLRTNDVLVVPGFSGVDESGRVTLLGRGGSDLTALFVSRAVGASACRLLKDVDGLYESDPAGAWPPPRRFAEVTYADALRLDGDIVQHKAVRFAQGCNLRFEVTAIGTEASTVVAAPHSAFDPVPIRVPVEDTP